MGVSIDTSCRGTELRISLRLLRVSSSSVVASSSSRAASELEERHWLMLVPPPEYSAQAGFAGRRGPLVVVTGDSIYLVEEILISRARVLLVYRQGLAHPVD